MTPHLHHAEVLAYFAVSDRAFAAVERSVDSVELALSSNVFLVLSL